MSNLTASEARGLMGAYTSIYQAEEDLTQEIFETIAYALISQGHTATDVLEYFANVDEEVIIEDLVALSEGTLIIESVVSEEYIEEQLEILNEALPLVGLASRAGMALARPIAGFVARNAPKVASVSTKLGQKAADVVWKGGSKSTPMGRFPKGTPTAPGTKLIGQKNVLQRAVGKVKDAARGALDKLPGGSGGKLASGLKTAGKWALGGAAFEAGARGVKALMGNKGPSAKTAPTKPPSLKAKQDYAASKGKYYSSSDQKTYKNYNDALAARNSRLGKTTKTTPTPAAPSLPAAVKSPAPKPSSTVKPTAQLSPGGRRGNEDLEGKKFPTGKTKGGTEYEVRTPTSAEMKASRKAGGGEAGVKAAVERSSKLMGGPEGPGQINKASVESDIKAAQEREKKKAQTVSASYEYDAYDLILEYLFSQGHVDTVEEALYVMMEMPAETIQGIIEQSNTLVTPEQRRADELKYGMKRTTQVPPPKPPTVKTGAGRKPPRMPL